MNCTSHSSIRLAAPVLAAIVGCGGPGQAVSNVSNASHVGRTACADVKPQRDRLLVAPTNLRSTSGTLYCSLFSGADGFPTDPAMALRRDQRKLSEASGCCVFDEVAPGSYAVSLLHDEDGSGDMTTNMFGAPTEGYGTSNDASPRGLSPPAYDDASFELSIAAEPLLIPIRY